VATSNALEGKTGEKRGGVVPLAPISYPLQSRPRGEEDGGKLADHPDRENYPGQRIYFVIVDETIYLVPHVVEKDYVFLKTIIPSRKATRAYKREQEVKT